MVALSRARLVVDRRITRQFIRDDPIRVILERRERIDTGTGGTQLGGLLTLEPQTFRLIEGTQHPFRALYNQEGTGTLIKEDWWLLGLWDADLQRGDEFLLPDSGRYEVRSLAFYKQVETIAGVVQVGVG